MAQPASVAKLMFIDALCENATGSILIKPLDVLGLFSSLSESGEKTHIWVFKNLGLVGGRAPACCFIEN